MSNVDRPKIGIALGGGAARGWAHIGVLNSLVEAGIIDVDPTMFGYAMWAATHGLVMLHQAGMLEHAPDYRTLAHFHGALMFKGAAPTTPAKKPGKKR